jgi:DNA-binding transcriptional MerR regulator
MFRKRREPAAPESRFAIGRDGEKLETRLMPKLKNAANDAANPNDVAAEAEGFTRIGEMSRTYNVTLRALRFYEDRGLLDPRREGATRLYSHRDQTRLKLILLGRRVGFSLREVKQIMDLYEPKGSNARQYKLLLEKSRRQLGRLEKQRATIDEAIVEVRNLIDTAQSRLGTVRSVRRFG